MTVALIILASLAIAGIATFVVTMSLKKTECKGSNKTLQYVDENIVTFKDVFEYYSLNGYIEECRKGKYKYSAQRLITIQKSSKTLQEMPIQELTLPTHIPDVGPKVYSLILHLVEKYQDDMLLSSEKKY